MKHRSILLTCCAALLVLAAACGKNPLGAGDPGGLKYYALMAKKVQKPDAINDEEKSKEGAADLVTEGTSMAKRAAAGTGMLASPPVWLIDSGAQTTTVGG